METKGEKGLVPRLLAFSHFARGRGLPISLQQELDIVEAAATGIIFNKSYFYFGLRAICCIDHGQYGLFDKLYRIFWLAGEDQESEGKGKTRINVSQDLPTRKATLAIWGEGETSSDAVPGKTVSGAHHRERLLKTDFTMVEEIESEWLEDLAYQLWREMSKRLKKRLKAQQGKDIVHLRGTIRKSLEQGGEPLRLVFRQKKHRKMRLVLLLDVSGSMEKYSFFLLRFIIALQQHFEKVESFVFSTHLERITDLIEPDALKVTLQKLSMQVRHWSGGTRIGSCLSQFNDRYAKQMVSKRSIVILLSDGLDTGTPGQLSRELRKIGDRAREIIWLNPLKGTESYEPTARGMAEALPYVDHFRSAHSLESILELENLLAHA